MLKLFGKKKSKERLSEVLQGCDPPCFPQGVMRLMGMLRDPETDVGDLAQALQWDPQLVIRILKLVNSSAFGLRRPVNDVQHAVTMMGRSQLEHMVLSVAVKTNLPSAPAPGFEAGRFWHTSFSRATVAKAFASKLHPAEEARSFTGGLLQDMAIPLLAHARSAAYGPVLEHWHEAGETELHVLEKQALGWTHDEVAGHLAVEWELPDSLTEVIHGHHTETELLPALKLVAIQRETQQEHGIEALLEEGRSRYGLDPDWARQAIVDADEKARELAQTL